MTVSVGDAVRVHYHPPGRTRSFAEGVVSRVDMTTSLGRGFMIDVRYDVIHGREQPIKPGYQNFVLYERWQDFPGRIERRSGTGWEAAPVPALDQEPEPEPALEVEPMPEPAEPADARRRGTVIRAMFGRRR